MQITELIPANGRKSFGGKAKLIETDAGKFLLSYETIVAGCIGGEVHRYWDAQSNTTNTHLASFFRTVGVSLTPKKFNSLPTEETPNL